MKISVVAGGFGVSAEMDAYNFANSIVTFVLSFVIAGVSTVVIPCYVKKEKKQYVDSFITIVFGAVFVASLGIVIFKDLIISSVSGRDAAFAQVAGNVLIILFLGNIFYFFTCATVAHFQCIGKYNIPKVVALLSQAGVVGCLLLLKDITIIQYAVIISVGVAVNGLIDIGIAFVYKWRYRPRLHIKSPQTGALLKLFLPILFSTGVYQLSLLVDSAIASRLDTGNITILNYANQISSMINTLIVGNLLVYLYPKIVKDRDDQKGRENFWKSSYFFYFVMCLVAVGYVVIGHEGVAVLFERGKFDADATRRVFLLSLLYVLVQPFNVIRDLVYRYFYAFSDTATPTKNSIIAGVVHLVLSLVLARWMGVVGIVLGTVLSSLVSLVAIMIKFKKIFGFGVKFKSILLQYLRTLLIAVVTAATVLLIKSVCPLPSKVLSLLVYGCITVVLYVILTCVFDKKILKTVTQI
ncbi:MAG: polysaccharide biosynthesis C-terminal domain-containing protein [Clostridia bacterium]|nr:polysaccharide biosynthesis C-terminal domain-containing protein [Clostridia bacterium]